ncbi:unnamed protein product [Amoebophrya sp. A120]|nr:unnamed protein product [Amoebophrya sp. A120]|eukprot:GSA120T00002291001.1
MNGNDENLFVCGTCAGLPEQAFSDANGNDAKTDQFVGNYFCKNPSRAHSSWLPDSWWPFGASAEQGFDSTESGGKGGCRTALFSAAPRNMRSQTDLDHFELTAHTVLQTGQLMLNMTVMQPLFFWAELKQAVEEEVSRSFPGARGARREQQATALLRQSADVDLAVSNRDTTGSSTAPLVIPIVNHEQRGQGSHFSFGGLPGEPFTSPSSWTSFLLNDRLYNYPDETDKEFVDRRLQELKATLKESVRDCQKALRQAYKEVSASLETHSESLFGMNKTRTEWRSEEKDYRGFVADNSNNVVGRFIDRWRDIGASSSGQSKNFFYSRNVETANRRKNDDSLRKAIIGVLGASAVCFTSWQLPQLLRRAAPAVAQRWQTWNASHLMCSSRHVRSFPHLLYTPFTAALSHQKPLHFLFNCGALYIFSMLLGFDMKVFHQVADRLNRECEIANKSDVDKSPPALSRLNFSQPTTAGIEYTKFVLATGSLSILAHCLSGAQRGVLGVSGTLMAMVTLAGCIEPERRLQMVFPVPGASVSLSQISDVNMVVNGGLALYFLLAPLLRRGLRFPFSSSGGFYSWNYRVAQRGGSFGNASTSALEQEPQVAWLAHAAGIGLGFGYYHYIHERLRLWPSNVGFSTTHTVEYMKYDWTRTYEDFKQKFDFESRRRF